MRYPDYMSDTLRYCTLRLKFAVLAPLTECHPPALLNILTSVFRDAGLRLASGREKRPKPMARLAYPLPLGVGGLEEWADITLETALGYPAEVITEMLKKNSPDGLEIIGVEQIPHYASTVDQLCEEAHWIWFCPNALFHAAKLKIDDFAGRDSFQITKTGKVEGKKGEKSIEVRGLVQDIRWDGAALKFSTRIARGQALNPIKILAAIVGIEPGQLGAVQRERVVLKTDNKLSMSDKYAHKLRNLYEDAVLLESGANIKVYRDDEDSSVIIGEY